jgi:hypothetical protein
MKVALIVTAIVFTLSASPVQAQFCWGLGCLQPLPDWSQTEPRHHRHHARHTGERAKPFERTKIPERAKLSEDKAPGGETCLRVGRESGSRTDTKLLS